MSVLDTCYWRVDAAPATDVIEEFQRLRSEFSRHADKVLQALGALGPKFLGGSSVDGVFIRGLLFEEDPGPAWRRDRKEPGFWVPNRNRRDGREAYELMVACHSPQGAWLIERLLCRDGGQTWRMAAKAGSSVMVTGAGIEWLGETVIISATRAKKPWQPIDGLVEIPASTYCLMHEEREVVLSS